MFSKFFIDRPVFSTVISLVIVVASPDSLSRPWVNFEAGGGWFKGLDLLAICHSGQQKSRLPPPLSDFQAI